MNPLLSIQIPIPFSEVRVEHVQPAIAELLQQAQSRIDSLAAEAEPATYEQTLAALDEATTQLDYAMSVVRHLESVATTPELRAAYNAVEPLVSAFYARIPLNPGLWKMLRQYADTADAKALAGARKRHLTKTLDFFRRHGAELDPAGKARLAEIDVELSKATTKFAENVLDATNDFELIVTDENQLAGLPPSAVAAARASAQSKGKEGWRFTLQGPSITAVLTYLDDPSIRETIYRAYATRASGGKHDNRGLVLKILELRREKARLLGFSD